MKILDLSAGNRAIWFRKDHPLATFVDRREEVKPTYVSDSRSLPFHSEAGFNLIVFDPPHVNCGPNGYMATRYGHHTTKEIRDIVRGTAKEAHRVTRENALMAFKWNDHDQSLDRMLELMSPWWEPLFGHHLRNRGGSSAKSQSYWVMLLRRPNFPWPPGVNR